MIAVTLAQWKELRELADRLADGGQRLIDESDATLLEAAIEAYNTRYGRG